MFDVDPVELNRKYYIIAEKHDSCRKLIFGYHVEGDCWRALRVYKDGYDVKVSDPRGHPEDRELMVSLATSGPTWTPCWHPRGFTNHHLMEWGASPQRTPELFVECSPKAVDNFLDVNGYHRAVALYQQLERHASALKSQYEGERRVQRALAVEEDRQSAEAARVAFESWAKEVESRYERCRDCGRLSCHRDH